MSDSNYEERELIAFLNKLENFVNIEIKEIGRAEKRLVFLDAHKSYVRELSLSLFSLGDANPTHPDFEKQIQTALDLINGLEYFIGNYFLKFNFSESIDDMPKEALRLIDGRIIKDAKIVDDINRERFANLTAPKKSIEELRKILKLEFDDKNLIFELDKKIGLFRDSFSKQNEGVIGEFKILEDAKKDLSRKYYSDLKNYASLLLKLQADLDISIRNRWRAIKDIIEKIYGSSRDIKDIKDAIEKANPPGKIRQYADSLKNIFSLSIQISMHAEHAYDGGLKQKLNEMDKEAAERKASFSIKKKDCGLENCLIENHP